MAVNAIEITEDNERVKDVVRNYFSSLPDSTDDIILGIHGEYAQILIRDKDEYGETRYRMFVTPYLEVIDVNPKTGEVSLKATFENIYPVNGAKYRITEEFELPSPFGNAIGHNSGACKKPAFWIRDVIELAILKKLEEQWPKSKKSNTSPPEDFENLIKQRGTIDGEDTIDGEEWRRQYRAILTRAEARVKIWKRNEANYIFSKYFQYILDGLPLPEN